MTSDDKTPFEKTHTKTNFFQYVDTAFNQESDKEKLKNEYTRQVALLLTKENVHSTMFIHTANTRRIIL